MSRKEYGNGWFVSFGIFALLFFAIQKKEMGGLRKKTILGPVEIKDPKGNGSIILGSREVELIRDSKKQKIQAFGITVKVKNMSGEMQSIFIGGFNGNSKSEDSTIQGLHHAIGMFMVEQDGSIRLFSGFLPQNVGTFLYDKKKPGLMVGGFFSNENGFSSLSLPSGEKDRPSILLSVMPREGRAGVEIGNEKSSVGLMYSKDYQGFQYQEGNARRIYLGKKGESEYLISLNGKKGVTAPLVSLWSNDEIQKYGLILTDSQPKPRIFLGKQRLSGKGAEKFTLSLWDRKGTPKVFFETK